MNFEGYVGKLQSLNNHYSLQILVAVSRKAELFPLGDFLSVSGAMELSLEGQYPLKFQSTLSGLAIDKPRGAYVIEFTVLKGAVDVPSVSAIIDKRVLVSWRPLELGPSPARVDLRPEGPVRKVEERLVGGFGSDVIAETKAAIHPVEVL